MGGIKKLKVPKLKNQNLIPLYNNKNKYINNIIIA